MRDHALQERHALAQTLRRAGPDAPTLSGEWSTAQLAAHLVLRERTITELAARLPIAAIQRQGEKRIEDLVRTEPYEHLVDLVERGPSVRDLASLRLTAPAWSLPVIREAFNTTEYLIHHEDVRRAADGWKPRALPVDLQMAVWKRLPFTVRIAMRKVPVGVELSWPGHGNIRNAAARSKGVAVRVIGDPVELILFASGRGPQAQVAYEGDADDVARVRGAKIAI